MEQASLSTKAENSAVWASGASALGRGSCEQR
jgi:hypothetical protein